MAFTTESMAAAAVMEEKEAAAMAAAAAEGKELAEEVVVQEAEEGDSEEAQEREREQDHQAAAPCSAAATSSTAQDRSPKCDPNPAALLNFMHAIATGPVTGASSAVATREQTQHQDEAKAAEVELGRLQARGSALVLF